LEEQQPVLRIPIVVLFLDTERIDETADAGSI
jgi:hypothetical protein